MHIGHWWESQKERDHWKDQRVGVWTILMAIKGTIKWLSKFRSALHTDGSIKRVKMDLREIGWDGVDWIDMAQNKDQRRTLVNTVLNIQVP
jgi:hypothetical protein